MENKALSKFIGNKIKLYRMEKKLTQEELAEKLGTKKATISNYETGYRSPQQNMLFEISKALDISINDLFPPTEKSKNKYEILQDIVTRSGKTQEEFASSIGLKKAAFNNYIKGRRDIPNTVMESLARVHNINPAVFFEENVPLYLSDILPNTSSLTQIKVNKILSNLENIRQEKVLKCAEDELKEQEKAKKKTSSTIHDEIKQTTDNIIHMPKTKADEKFIPVKYYGAVSAGTGEFLFGVEIADTVYLPEIKLPTTPFDYALRINGDSMEPAFKHRQYIFVQSFSEGGDIRDGMLAIVLYESQVYFKKLCIENECVRLVSLNKKYSDIHVTNPDGFKVLGKVIV